jgi:hypothetical protein
MFHIQFSLFCSQPGNFLFSVSICFISSLNLRVPSSTYKASEGSSELNGGLGTNGALPFPLSLAEVLGKGKLAFSANSNSAMPSPILQPF